MSHKTTTLVYSESTVALWSEGPNRAELRAICQPIDRTPPRFHVGGDTSRSVLIAASGELQKPWQKPHTSGSSSYSAAVSGLPNEATAARQTNPPKTGLVSTMAG